jgi:hypothetical protein
VTITWRTWLAWLAGATLIAAGLTLVFAGPGAGATLRPQVNIPAAAANRPAAQPGSPNAHGDNGTVKIHRSSTPESDPRNEPHVCVFYLDGFGFDPGQQVAWQIVSWPPTGDRSEVTSGTLVLDANGHGRTTDMTLPDGHYKLYWNFAGEKGRAKQKVFWVACGAQTSPPPPPSSPPPPSCTPPPPSPGSPSATPTCGTLPPSSSPPSTSSSTSPSSPQPSPSPSPSASNVGSGLPITGRPLAFIAGSGAVLLGVGALALLVARRRNLNSSR